MSNENEAYETGFSEGQAAEAQTTGSESELNGLLCVGEYTISNDGESINIVMTDGEGGGFDIDLFEKCIADFYSKHF